MPAYLVIKMFKVLKVESVSKYNSDGSVNVSLSAYNPTQLNWAIITAANKYEADGKAKENLEIWLAANKESFDKDREGANAVTQDVFVWEIDNPQAEVIASIMIQALKDGVSKQN